MNNLVIYNLDFYDYRSSVSARTVFQGAHIRTADFSRRERARGRRVLFPARIQPAGEHPFISSSSNEVSAVSTPVIGQLFPTMATVEELKLRVRELENELIKCKQRQCAAEEVHKLEAHRPKIDKMSAEVVDSNPYR